MGADYYGFSEMPFRLTPDSRFFFASHEHSRALSHLVFGLAQQEGFIVVTGEVGAGKTMLLERLWTRLDHESYLIGRVDMAQVAADDLLRLIAASFGVAPAPDKASLLGRIVDVLRKERAGGRRCLLVVDEVQALPLPALEELRMLSNVVEGGRALLQAILLGQPQFRRTLASTDLDQLRQRVLASYHLGPLSEKETRAYIEHRLHAVGWHDRPTWDEAAFGIVHQFSGGIPRRINRLCGRVLLHGEFERSAAISAAMVEATALELQQDLGSTAAPRRDEPSDALAEIRERLRILERAVDRRERIFSRLLDLLDDWRATR